MEASVLRESLLMAGRVKRYHVWAVLNAQTVAEHSWHLARIYAAVFGMPSAEVAYFIQNHDSAEVQTGDMPFHAKRGRPGLKREMDSAEVDAFSALGVSLPNLTECERARVKACDLLEMMSFGMMEREMGNRLALPIIHDTQVGIRLHLSKLGDEDARAVVEYADAEWARHRAVMNAN